jgi:hypothetical protein
MEVVMSEQERVSWVSLLVTLVIGIWYFSGVLALPADASLHTGAMARFVTKLIVFAIVLTIAGEALLHWAQRRMQGDAAKDATTNDERDALIHLKATRNANIALTIGVIFVLVQIALLESAGRWLQGRQHRVLPTPETVLEQLLTGPLSALHVAQLLLLALTIAGAVVYASRIFYYRRGY